MYQKSKVIVFCVTPIKHQCHGATVPIGSWRVLIISTPTKDNGVFPAFFCHCNKLLPSKGTKHHQHRIIWNWEIPSWLGIMQKFMFPHHVSQAYYFRPEKKKELFLAHHHPYFLEKTWQRCPAQPCNISCHQGAYHQQGEENHLGRQWRLRDRFRRWGPTEPVISQWSDVLAPYKWRT